MGTEEVEVDDAAVTVTGEERLFIWREKKFVPEEMIWPIVW